MICPICSEAGREAGFYFRCGSCGHEWTDKLQQAFIVNEILDTRGWEKPSRLDRFKLRIAEDFDLSRRFLVDFGCGGGRFLGLAARRFDRVAGVEITESTRDFARSRLGLEVVERIDQLEGEPSIVTFWHSLEHLPLEVAQEVLGYLSTLKSRPVVFISVPNAVSRQAKWFGKGFAYFDPASHLHQFSVASLDLLMERQGYRLLEEVWSFSYEIFGWIQGLLNLVDPTPNYLYYRLKRDVPMMKRPVLRGLRDGANLAGAAAAVVPALALMALDGLSPSGAAVINRAYRFQGAD